MRGRLFCQWVCDRCEKKVTSYAVEEAPGGWGHVVLGPYRREAEKPYYSSLCDECLASLKDWWAKGTEPVETGVVTGVVQ